MTITRQHLILVAVGAAALLTLISVLAGSNESSTTRSAAAQPNMATLAANYAVFRGPADTGFKPAGVVSDAEDASLAREALTTPSGTSVYVVPAGGEVCVRGEEVGGTCAPVALAIKQPVVSIGVCAPSIRKGKVVVSALAPDGTTDFDIVSSDGSVTPAKLANNVVFAEVSNATASPVTLRWKSASGDRSTALNSVPTAEEANCG